MHKVVVIRHPRENKKKCSMRFLEGREGYFFDIAADGFSFDATGYLLLEIGAPQISEAHKGLPILLLDSTWHLLPRLRGKVKGDFIPVSLPPHLATAYPRKSKLFGDPSGGLATVEALYAALRLMGQPDESVLDNYRFKEEFLKKNFPQDFEPQA